MDYGQADLVKLLYRVVVVVTISEGILSWADLQVFHSAPYELQEYTSSISPAHPSIAVDYSFSGLPAASSTADGGLASKD